MNTNIKYIAEKACMALAACLLLGSCSDEWDDHYKPGTSATNTLWEAISANPDLSNFAHVLSGCGYDRNLSGSQTFTVFALTNDALTGDQADSLVNAYQEQKGRGVKDDDNTVLKQFVKNHLALYSKPVSSLTNDTVTMMNGKYEPRTATTIGGQPFLTSNELHSNGVLYTIGHRISYFPNVFEYLGIDHDIDSAYNFLNSFSRYEFNEAASVPGGINEDGQTVYLDSVSYLQNILFNQLGYIDIEDSTYWMLVPTNDQWTKLLNEYYPYFNYANTLEKRDSMQNTNARLAILQGTVFSRTINPDAAFRDSAVSTQAQSYAVRRSLDVEPYNIFYHPFDAGGIFNGATDVECSNGHVLKASDFRIRKEQTFFQTIKVEGEDIARQDTMFDVAQPLPVQNVSTDNPFYDKISGNTYADVIAENTSEDENHFPVATIQYSIPNVLANVPYDIYVVFASPRAGNQYISDDDLLPNRVLTTLYYLNRDNRQQSRRLGQRIVDPTKTDTIQVASAFTFPACSWGLTTPIVKVRLQNQVSKNQTSVYSQEMHIDCIIFKPHED